MARPKIYESAAARQAAFREANRRIDLTVTTELGETIDELSDTLGITKNSVVNALIRFALTNHDWKKRGLWVTKK